MSLVKRNLVIKITNIQPAFTCPKSITEIPKKDANHVQTIQYTYTHNIYNRQPRTHHTHCSSASVANPEHAIVC